MEKHTKQKGFMIKGFHVIHTKTQLMPYSKSAFPKLFQPKNLFITQLLFADHSNDLNLTARSWILDFRQILSSSVNLQSQI